MGKHRRAISPRAWLRRRRLRLVIAAACVAAVACVLVVQGVGSAPDRRTGRVMRVADGLHVAVLFDGASEVERVRLCGVRRVDAWAADAESWLRRAVVGRRVMVILPAGAGGAALVYRDDGLFINEHLVDQGLATAEAEAPAPWGPWFGRVEGWAREGGRGGWGESAPPETAPGERATREIRVERPQALD